MPALRSFKLDRRPAPRPRREKLEYDYSRARRLAKSAWDKGEALARSGDVAAGLAWVGRANRIAPADQNILFSLAWLSLRAGDTGQAIALFGRLADRHATRECFCGLIAALLAAGRREDAAHAAHAALSQNAADQALCTLAERAAAGTRAGWCAIDEKGALLANAPRAALAVSLDGEKLGLRTLGPGRYGLGVRLAGRGHRLEVRTGDVKLLGSPLRIDRIFRVEGFAERTPQGVRGWAWHPGAPGRLPRLVIADEAGAQLASLTPSEELESIDNPTPLARPNGFTVRSPPDRVVRVIGPDGRDLLGSPVAPEKAAPPPGSRRRKRRHDADVPVDVVIPVYRGMATTLSCIGSVLDTIKNPSRIWVVNDASPEPELVAALGGLARSGAIRLIGSGDGGANRGFPAAANAGMKAARGRHVVLLNSDTLVAPGWLARLTEAACSAPDIGTATPISNEASILSYPGDAGRNAVPDRAATHELARLAAKANRGRLVEIPTANGFCMFIRRDCLEQTGLFDERLFAQGYGEENDFCERARALGWRHVAVPEVFVAHLGGASFGTARDHLLRRNLHLLGLRHPAYHARVAAWIEADPLAPARRRLDAARWRHAGTASQPPAAGAPGPSILIVTHGGGGGTSRVVGERMASLRAQGYRPVVLKAAGGYCEIGDDQGIYPNLRFVLPGESAALQRLLAQAQPVGAELHHLLGHDHAVVDVFAALGIPYDVWVHDYSWFCPRLSFVTGEGRFCGEAAPKVCEACVQLWGREIEEEISAADLRRRSAADLLGARRVIVPSADVARRVGRHVPGLRPEIRAWEDDAPTIPARRAPGRGRRRVAVIGAISLDKGYEVLLACARDAAARDLDLEFVVVGFTMNDEALLETDRVFITGMFAPDEAVPLIRAQSADLAFLPSIWPETWCYALSDAWAGGLPAAVFDIGTPPARIRATGRGWVLPLGLPAARVNDALLSLAMLNITPLLSRAI
jgi:GT2 family glycosyltransferase/glycosyltransferase involved in cell wall biosynthesis